MGEYKALVAEAGPGIHLETENWAHWIAGSKSTTLDLVPGLGAAACKCATGKNGAGRCAWRCWRWWSTWSA
ncbi:hypothetical protein LP419_17935 [Massilia sp. H-1]|nr:hypothetical protein LP419_17935 [Massilia sp. H-1]